MVFTDKKLVLSVLRRLAEEFKLECSEEATLEGAMEITEKVYEKHGVTLSETLRRLRRAP